MKRKTVLILVAATIGAFFLGRTTSGNEKWEGYVYYDRNDLSVYQAIGYYDSLEECREFSTRKMNEWGSPHSRTYECAYNCRINKEVDMRVCEKVSR